MSIELILGLSVFLSMVALWTFLSDEELAGPDQEPVLPPKK